MSNSKLASVTLISPNKNSPRNKPIDRISIHCFVGQVTAKRGCEVFQPTSKKASCNYVVGYDGSIGLCVDEGDRSWCTSSAANDHRAVTIETASDNKDPYAVTDKAYAALLDLVEDICRRNGKTKLLWLGDKDKTLAFKPAADEMVLTVHRWFAKKACPGQYLLDRHPEIAAEVTRRLGGGSQTSGSGTAQATDNLYRVRKTWADAKSQVGAYKSMTNAKRAVDSHPGYAAFDGTGKQVYPELESSFEPYQVQVTTANLRIRTGPGTNYAATGGFTGAGVFTIVEESPGTGSTAGWGKLKSGAGWISLDYATKTGTSSSTASKAVTVGSTVTIQAGAVYGGLATSRGAKVPDYVSGKNRRYTVKQIATHKGVQEALLKEITSWVALSYLTVV